MTAPATTEVRLPDDRPPRWANSLMKWALTTPVLQSMVGKGVALLTFTGRRSGKTYTVPVSYHQEGDLVTVITKRQRKWWHNLEMPTEVGLRLAGRDYTGKAQIHTAEAETLDFMLDYLGKRPIDAKAYGLGAEEVTREKVGAIIPYVVVIRIEIAPVAG